MKVIASGKKKWFKQLVCKGCTAVLEAEEGDIEYWVSDSDAASQQYQLDIEGTYFVTCPECSQQISIKSKDIPPVVKERLRI